MAFRYINPGYGNLTGDSSVNTFNNSTFNPANGVAFQKYDSSNYDNAVKIAIPQAFSSDIYGKFNLYYDTSDLYLNYFFIGAISSKGSSSLFNNAIGITIRSFPTEPTVYLCDVGTSRGTGIALKKNSLNSIWFHWNKDATNSNASSGELIVNGTSDSFQNTNSTYGFSNEKFFFINFPSKNYNGDKIYVSELIISDEYISPHEKIVALPIDATETTMTAGANEIYIADAVNQTLLQMPDVDALLTEYGATSQVTGIALVGNPAYRTGEEIRSLIGLSKANGTITEHDSCALDTSSSAVVMDGWNLNNVTISDLQNMQFGWKVGT